jgi:hypothetical protein
MSAEPSVHTPMRALAEQMEINLADVHSTQE